jgi:hypothetical protein
MTSTSPVPTPVRPPQDAGGVTPSDEVGPNARPGENLVAASTSPEARPGGTGLTSLWFLADCDRCGGDLAQPFRRQAERDQWAIDHLLGTGHAVRLSVDGLAEDLHLTTYLRYTDGRDGFKWLCPAPQCAKWIGPYETPQLALADWRGHARLAR